MSVPTERPTDAPGNRVSANPDPPPHSGWAMAFVAAGVSGVLLAACYPPLNLHNLAWIALVPWLVVLPRPCPGVGGGFQTTWNADLPPPMGSSSFLLHCYNMKEEGAFREVFDTRLLEGGCCP